MNLRYESPHPLSGCQLKMRRADEHFEALQNSMHDFMRRDPYEVIQDFDSEANQYVVRVKVRERPPIEWSPIIGDIIHNIRSSLDHLAWQLVKRNAEEPIPGKTQFPIFSKDPFDRNAFAKTKDWNLYDVVKWRGRGRTLYRLAASPTGR